MTMMMKMILYVLGHPRNQNYQGKENDYLLKPNEIYKK